MSERPRWQPLTRADVEAFGTTLAHQLDAWLTQWLSDPRPVVACVHALQESTMDEIPAEAWRLTPWQRVSVHPALMARAAARALAVPPGAQDTETEAVLTALAQALVQDLRAQVFPTESDAGATAAWAHGGYRFEFEALGHKAAVTCWVAREHLWSLVEPTGAVMRAAPPTPVREALAMRTVTVDVRLGDCRLRASDVWGLQCGDVLITTRALTEPVELELVGGSGWRTVVAHGQLGQRDSRMALNLTAVGGTA